MVEPSEQLKQKFLDYWELRKDHYNNLTLKPPRDGVKFIMCPIFFDGIADTIRYNVEEKRFDRFEILIATEGIVKADWIPDDAAYCSDFEMAIIDIPPI